MYYYNNIVSLKGVKMKIVLILAAFLFSHGFASLAEQSDWSGGAGVTGPADTWGDTFSSSESIAFISIPGQFQLSSLPISPTVEHLVESGITNPYSACVADLNGDGFNDLVSGSAQNDGVLVWFGSVSGEWTQQIVSDDSPAAIGLAVGDFDMDGLLDIAATADSELHVFYNGGGELPSWEKETAGSGYQSLHDVESVDMDADGDLDLVVSDYDGDRLFWLRNEGTSWTDLTIDSVIDYPCKQYPADINGDGNMDVVCAAWTGGVIMAFYGSGGENPSWTSQTVDPNCTAAHGTRACDIDNDGDMDIVSASINNSRLYLYRNGGGSTPSWDREDLGTIAGASMVRLGDLDGDGDMDAVSSSWGNSGVAWWENTENAAVFIKHIVKTGGQATSWAVPGDMDNDGDLDVVAVRYQQGSLYWYEVTEFESSGMIESSILDTEESPVWSSFDWNATVPGNCGISFQFKSSDDFSSMGEWSEEYFSPAVLSGLVDRYFQYRFILSSSDPLFSPVVRSVQLNWDPQGIEECEGNDLISCHSPCTGMITLRVSEELGGPLAVDLYSSAGRLLFSRSVDSGETLALEGLSSGLYLYRAESTDGVHQLGSTVLLSR